MADAKSTSLRILEAAGIQVGGDRPWDIQVHDERLWNRVLRDRELGLGESYQDGWWDTPRLDEFLTRILGTDAQQALKPGPQLLFLAAKAQIANRQTVRQAKRNASAHYDIGNDLYERMLDKRMVYSAGYWANTSDLDQAQEAKLDLICRKLHLEPGMRLLDIGCGWGALAIHAAQHYAVDVVGISPAHAQVVVARERSSGLSVDIREMDYRSVDGTFDRITSVGMMEHVGPKNLRTFFETCRERLAPDGMMLHHTIGSNESKQRSDPWFDKYIFPGGVIPSMEQIGKAALHDWAIEDVHNFGPDYDRTLLVWFDRIESHWSEMPNYDERFRRTWRYYLLASAASFRVRNLQLWQVVFRRSRHVSDVYQAVR